MKLNYIETTYKLINYSDLDKFISNLYNIDYESIVYEEWNNYSYYKLYVTPEKLDSYNKPGFDEKIYEYMTQDLLCDACSKGYIEPGEYLVEVYW